MQQGLGSRRAEGGDGAVAVGEERGGEGDAWVEGLADEEVAVVEGGGGEADEELLWAWGGDGDGVELEAGDRVSDLDRGGWLAV